MSLACDCAVKSRDTNHHPASSSSVVSRSSPKRGVRYRPQASARQRHLSPFRSLSPKRNLQQARHTHTRRTFYHNLAREQKLQHGPTDSTLRQGHTEPRRYMQDQIITGSRLWIFASFLRTIYPLSPILFQHASITLSFRSHTPSFSSFLSFLSSISEMCSKPRIDRPDPTTQPTIPPRPRSYPSLRCP